MKQTLQLKLSQHLTLTPQLQQSIRLLQLSTIELNQEVERLLQENPLLERAEAEEEAARPEEVPLAGPNRLSEVPDRVTQDTPDSNAAEARGAHDDAPDPSDFTDFGGSGGGDGDWGGSGSGEDDDFYPQQVATSSLRDHLNEQLRTMSLELRDRQIVGALIDALDDDGYLQTSLEELAELFPAELEIEPEELSIALKYLQSFDPAGVGARDCAECLALQLKALPTDTPHRADALKIVDGNLELLANRDFTKLKRL
ncbi:MAG: RNA polymerase factor sigma-54, partial [Casimicrobiaceae bacterium]